MTYRVLSLFSGIGSFDLGLERAGGFRTVALCEINPYRRKVLARHWPEIQIHEDVRTLTADALARDGIEIDAIVGGFPCRNVSIAGYSHGIRSGITGEHSGLWCEYERLIEEIRPKFVIVENVRGLLRSRAAMKDAQNICDLVKAAEPIMQALEKREQKYPERPLPDYFDLTITLGQARALRSIIDRIKGGANE
jgi:site-specific DNA-cytosine methylase